MTTASKARHSVTAAFAAFLSLGTALPALAADTLTVFDWSGYEAPEFHPGYVEKHGQSPTFTFFASSATRAVTSAAMDLCRINREPALQHSPALK